MAMKKISLENKIIQHLEDWVNKQISVYGH